MMEGEVARDRERDAEMDRLLRAALTEGPAGPANACPEADELAAYVEGTLAAGEREALEPHLAACERCQEALASMATMPEAPAVTRSAAPAIRSWWLGGWRRWLVPVSALVSAVIVYVALRPEVTRAPALPQETNAATSPATVPGPGDAAVPESTRRAAADMAAPATEAVAPRGKSEPKDEAPRQARSREELAETLAAKTAPVPQLAAAPGAAAPSSPAPPLPAVAGIPGERVRESTAGAVGGVLAMRPSRVEAEGALAPKGTNTGTASIAVADQGAPTIVRGGDAAAPFLWRFDAGGRIFGSADRGGTWQLQHTATGELSGGSAPSRQVCWAVGPAGLVLRTTDGESWQPVAFPERVDLVAVDATSAFRATVHARDGRRFATDDGGETWQPR
jgi:hypothetical protein